MSKPYMISYDLNSPGQKYKEINTILRSDKVSTAYTKKLETTVLIRSNLSALEIIEELESSLDTSDRFIITEILPSNYSGWLTDSDWEWLKKNILY